MDLHEKLPPDPWKQWYRRLREKNNSQRLEPLHMVQYAPLTPSYTEPIDTEPIEMVAPEEDLFAKLLEFWHILWQNKITIIALTLVGVLAGLAYHLFQVPKYQAAASMEIQGSPNALSPINLTGSDASIQTQIDIIKSKSLLIRAKKKMAPKSHLESEGRQDLLASWRKVLGVQSKKGLEAWHEAVQIAQSTLGIDSKRDSQITTLRCESTDPQVAAEFINTVANEYIQQRVEERWEAYQSTSKWLIQAQEELRVKLEASENELQRFARESGLLFTADTQNIAEEKLRQLQAQLSKIQGERIAKQAQYEASKSSRPEALPEVLDSGPIGTYQVQLTELRRQLADLGSALTPEHYKIKRLQAQISELESISERERSNIIKRIKNEYDAALRTENQIRSEYDRQAGLIFGEADNVIHYKILQREAETNRQLYTLTLQKGKEASIASALRESGARVIDSANAPGAPYKPILVLNLAAGLMGGFFLGAAFVFIRARLHAAVHLPGNLPLLSSVRELGVIPSAKLGRLSYAYPKRRISGAPKRALMPAGRILFDQQSQEASRQQREGCLELVTWNEKTSVMAEAFRSAMASILFSSNSETGRPQAIVFTSPSPKEGKTTIACNLGIALAEINHSVLLVDADMRLPRLHSIFDVANSWGLSNLLQDRTPIQEYSLENLAHKTEIPGLFILPSGSARTNLSSLFYSSRLPELLARCRREFPVVLIDAPPVLRVPDARILSRAADSTVLVFRVPSTTRDEAAAAIRCFQEDGILILGTILNDWNPNHAGYGSYQPTIPIRRCQQIRMATRLV